MKRRFISLLLVCCCAASLLVTRAAAADDEINVATGDALMCITTYSSTVTNQGLFSQSWGRSVSNDNDPHILRVSLPISIEGNHTYIYTLTWEEEFSAVSGYITSSDYFKSLKVSRGTESVSYLINNDLIEAPGFSIYRSVSSIANSSGYLRHISVSIVVDDPTITDFEITTQEHEIHKVQTSPISVIDISDATLDDVVAQLVKLTNTTSSSGAASSAAIQGAISSLQQSMSGSNEELKTSLSEVKQAVIDMTEALPGAVEEGMTNALDAAYDKWSKKAQEMIDAAVEEIKAAIPVDTSQLDSSFNQLYNSVSTHDMACVVTLPAGSVTLDGQTYTFWESQSIDFEDVFTIPGVSLLLLPIRFVFVFGMANYVLWFFKELLKICSLHVDDDH